MDVSTQSAKISIVGTEGTGKTVFLAVLANALSSAKRFPRITGENMRTRRYTAEVLDDLENGKWPPSTLANVKRELKWCWYDRDGDPHELATFDCAGQDFRAIFESERDEELNEKQRALKRDFHDCDLILLLLNLQDALNIYKKPGTSLARIDIEYAPSTAVRKLRRGGITLYAIFTQSDLYEERIRSEWNGNYSNALRDLLPDLYNALSETGSQFAVARAIDTEKFNGEIIPKKGKNSADFGTIIRSVDDFFAKRKEETRQAELSVQEAAARKRAEEERRWREEEEQGKKRIEEENRVKAEHLIRQKTRKKYENLVIGLFVFVVFLTGLFLEGLLFEKGRVIREEKAAIAAAADAKNLAEKERVRIEQESVRAKKEQTRAEQERIRVEQERIERKAREKKEAAAFIGKLQNREIFCIPNLNINMQPIPAGSFMMGSSANEEGHYVDEKLHRVTISKPFWLGRYEVTQSQWEAVMGTNPSHFKRADKPVEQVLWDEAKAFCDKLTEIEGTAGRLPAGYRYTLPTEAEWEYACRAGTMEPFGRSGRLEDMAWYDENSERKTHPVGQRQSNAWGLYDMHGNVFEWCRDWHGSYPDWDATDPTGPASGSVRVVRGGSWVSNSRRCRSAERGRGSLTIRDEIIGFRLALSSTKD